MRPCVYADELEAIDDGQPYVCVLHARVHVCMRAYIDGLEATTTTLRGASVAAASGEGARAAERVTAGSGGERCSAALSCSGR